MVQMRSCAADFWEEACHTMTRRASELLLTAGEAVTVENLCTALNTMPRDPDDFQDEKWRETSYCAQCLLKMEQGESSPGTKATLADFFLVRVPTMTSATLLLLQESILGVLRGAAVVGALRGVSLDK